MMDYLPVKCEVCMCFGKEKKRKVNSENKILTLFDIMVYFYSLLLNFCSQ